MSFWGIEVKPGIPFTHYCEKARGRLRISQATLGIGEATMSSVVQCNVGNRSPVFLCVLLPSKTESCHLDLEFEEVDDVIFSVIGPRSVYLTGYYVQNNRGLITHSDIESLGVDIENTNTEGSSYRSDDDKYGGSFINDDNSKGVDEGTLENDELKDINGGDSGQRREKYLEAESGDDGNSHEKNDEVSHSLSTLNGKTAMETTACIAADMIPHVTVEMGDEEKVGVCGADKLNGSILHANENPTEENALDEANVSNDKVLTGQPIHESTAKDAFGDQRLPTSMENHETQSLDLCEISEKSKKKRKKHSKEEKSRTIPTDNRDNVVLAADQTHEVEASTNMDIDVNSEDGKASKKRKSLEHADNSTQELQGLEEIGTEEIGKAYAEMPKEDNLIQVLSCVGSPKEDLQEERGRSQDQQIANIICTLNEDIRASHCQPDKKIKKKKKNKKKTLAHEDLNFSQPDMEDDTQTMAMGTDHQIANAVPSLKQTLSNGLIIEELTDGPPDAKVAASGNKIKIYYTAMLKETGHVFDSNIGKSALRFRLGDEDFLDGWNVGINGMRVGGKRRLIIPPSMGFGGEGLGEDVPPDSWLIYDVELVSVRK